MAYLRGLLPILLSAAVAGLVGAAVSQTVGKQLPGPAVVASAPVVAPTNATEKIAIDYTDNAIKAQSGASNKKDLSVTVTITKATPGKLTARTKSTGRPIPSSAGSPEQPIKINLNHPALTMGLDLSPFNDQDDQIYVEWISDDPLDSPIQSNALPFRFDTKGPKLVGDVRVVAAPGDNIDLALEFDDSDLLPASLVASNFRIQPSFGVERDIELRESEEIRKVGRQIVIPIKKPDPNFYKLTLVANKLGTGLRDVATNPAHEGANKSLNFRVEPQANVQLVITYQGTDAAIKNGLISAVPFHIPLTIGSAKRGRVVAKVGTALVSEPVDVEPPKVPTELIADLSQFANRGRFDVFAEWMSEDLKQVATSNVLKFELDTRGPIAEAATLVGTVDGKTDLQIRFDSTDLKSSTIIPRNFRLITSAGKSIDVVPRSGEQIVVDRNIVTIPIGPLPTGNYEVEVTGSRDGSDPTTPLQDEAGNFVGGSGGQGKSIRLPFSSYPQAQKGPHVEFPDFVPRVKPPPGGFNPGDKVETRVARLYYYRDGHRVAEIINRNVQSYNRAAVDQKRREAESSRGRADSATDERRSRERDAVQSAQEARRAEREQQKAEDLAARARAKAKEDADNLKVAQSQLDAAAASKKTAEDRAIAARKTYDDRQKAVVEAKRKLDSLEANDPGRNNAAITLENAEIERDGASLDKQQAEGDLQSEKTHFDQASAAHASASKAAESSENDRRDKEADVRIALAKVEATRNSEIAKREESLQAEAREDRANEDKFRKEVAAAHEDPDTYAPGKITSVDPITQVSISVIGEGLIQLRGPIRGINRIRTMIDQIDSPMGQVKVGVFTVQINGEHGDRMEKVAQRIEGNVDVSRFLTSQSMMLLRRAVQEVASQVALEAERGGHSQVDRDRKYLYSFFGRDFVDELYATNSEFLYSGNKVLSLHSMDTVSRSSALFITALAKNSTRQRILDRFMELVRCELPQAEYDFRKASKVLPCGRNTLRECYIKANELYTFRSLRGMFDIPLGDEQQDIMTPMQREFIRLAQIFKSQMVAEIELKQRVIERGLIEDREGEEEELARLQEPAHRRANESVAEGLIGTVEAQKALAEPFVKINEAIVGAMQGEEAFKLDVLIQDVEDLIEDIQDQGAARVMTQDQKMVKVKRNLHEIGETIRTGIRDIGTISEETKDRIRWYADDIANKYPNPLSSPATLKYWSDDVQYALTYSKGYIKQELKNWDGVRRAFAKVRNVVDSPNSRTDDVEKAFDVLFAAIAKTGTSKPSEAVRQAIFTAYRAVLGAGQAESYVNRARIVSNRTRRSLDHKKLLDYLIDEKEEKWIELREGTKSHIATMDNYLKRLAIALEDDFKVQYYDPAFVEVRKAAREWDVNLGQVERTTILTNNRQFAKVSPSATMEFDLPKRDILIQEAMKGAKAMVQDYGALLQDPTFLAATKMLSGSPTASTSTPPKPNVAGAANEGQPGTSVKNTLSSLPSSTEEEVLNQSTGQERELGAALEALIPDPAIYKFETGTGFEIRPVIQPDGDSIIYDFNYMYTTNVREPVRADEKHLGRVKRHFIDTQVQTSSFELREISRYQVALKASRTGRGVPLFEDIPGLGVLFRPQPSQDSSLQQNIILGQSTVYPTLFDLMGLRWAPHVVDLDHDSLRDEEHVVRGRHKTIEDFVFEEASDKVDGFLGIKDDPQYKELRRRDLYHRQQRPSPYHPGGYTEPNVTDPTGREFEIPDRRPTEMREPMFDPLRRQEVPEEPIGPGLRSNSTRPAQAPELLPAESMTRQSRSKPPPSSSPRSDGFNSGVQAQRVNSDVRTAAYEEPESTKAKRPTKPNPGPKGTEDDSETVVGRIKKMFGR
jgi:hypothetical protein